MSSSRSATGGVLGNVFGAVTHILAPRLCQACGCTLATSERLLCLGCSLDLPRTHIHLQDFNELHRRLGSEVPVERAAAWYTYDRDSVYAGLIRRGKYADRPAQCRQLGRLMAEELAADAFFDGIDLVVPMPMWWWKRLRRGYNQASEIALGIADVTGIRVDDRALGASSHGSQALQSAATRGTNVRDTVWLRHAHNITGAHVLLVDDIVTTGATMRQALKALSGASPSAISVAAVGLTKFG